MFSRRTALKTMGLLSLGAMGNLDVFGEVRKKPNVIVIITDDAGYADFGFNGCKDTPTPNIDSLAREGTIFKQGYVTASVCGPSRSGLMTGRYQQRFGSECNGSNQPAKGYTKEDLGLDVSELTMGDHFQKQGYKTLAVGKWHLGHQQQYHPCNRGFDEFYGFLAGSRSYMANEKIDYQHALRNCQEQISEDNIKYMTDQLTDSTLEFIDRNKTNPFFIYLAYNAVHTPMEAPDYLIDKYKEVDANTRRIHIAMTDSLDTNIGRLREKLIKLGLENDTMVFFVNDNGGATNNGSDNGKLRGMKGSKWEGGIRVPFAVKWPGNIPAGKTYDNPVSTLDILPTALAGAGVKKAETATNKKLDGVNLLPYIQGKEKTAPHEILFWRRAVAGAVRKGKWKLIIAQTSPLLLFDIENDESEQNNLATKYPEKTKELLQDYRNWEKELIEPKWREGAKWERNQMLKHRMEVNTRELERKLP